MNWLRRGTLTALSRLRSIAPAENNLNRQVSIPSHGTVERELARQWSQSSLDTGIHTGTGAWAWLLSQSQSSSQGLSLRGVHGTSVAWSSDAAAFSDRSTPPDNADSAHSYPGRGGSSPSRKKGPTKVCINPECRLELELRFFSPSKSDVDGLQAACRGCQYRIETYRRLITRHGFSESRAEQECRQRFDVPKRWCGACETDLPATFFYPGKYGGGRCIVCRGAYIKQWRSKLVPNDSPPAQRECARCRKMLPADRFRKCRIAVSGLQSYCTPCANANAQEMRQAILKVPQPATFLAPVKKCTVCQEVKPRSAFYKCPRERGGRLLWCKICSQGKAKRLRAQHKEIMIQG